MEWNTNYYGTTFDGMPGSFNSSQINACVVGIGVLGPRLIVSSEGLGMHKMLPPRGFELSTSRMPGKHRTPRPRLPLILVYQLKRQNGFKPEIEKGKSPWTNRYCGILLLTFWRKSLMSSFCFSVCGCGCHFPWRTCWRYSSAWQYKQLLFLSIKGGDAFLDSV